MDRMSPASKSKPTDKKSGKDPQKVVLKTSEPAAVGTGVCASAYSPHLGTFHSLGSAPPYLSASSQNDSGHLRTIDDSDELCSDSLGVLVECDAASNNGSWSGDSEDRKQKGSSLSDHEDRMPGVDCNKREKVRHKNGKKHQRQKEKRAQELHDRCRSYLMSRKLDALVQKLVGMGFPHERATTALIWNEGRVEESVAWLFEGSEEDRKPLDDQDSDRRNMRMDISDELAQISMMESRYHCSKQEVERAVVSCEGDLERASDILRTQKQGPSNAKTVDVEDATDYDTMSRFPARPQLRHGTSSSSIQRKDGRYYKSINTVVDSNGQWESGDKNVQLVKSYQPQLDWAAKHEPPVPCTGKSLASSGANSSISYSMAAPVATSASKRVPLYVAIGSEMKPLPSGSSAKEPATLTQRLQSTNKKHSSVPLVGLLPEPAANWHSPNSQLDIIKSIGLSDQFPPSGRNPPPGTTTSGMMCGQLNYQHQMGPGSSLMDPQASIGFQQQQFIHSSGVGEDIPTPGRGNPSWQRRGAYATVAAASSLGLFSMAGSGSASLGPVNWTDGSRAVKLDYNNVDWSMGATSLRPPRNLWLGPSSSLTDKNKAGVNDTDISENSSGLPASSSSSGGPGSDARDWTSPFEGRDLFSLSRQLVSSPSL